MSLNADALGRGLVHVLGNSLGARIALELARRDRALSIVAIAPSGLNMLHERIYQGAAMSTFRLLKRPQVLVGLTCRAASALLRFTGGNLSRRVPIACGW
jgi:pimeloyl-ACP methyl ester carboxylesterase